MSATIQKLTKAERNLELAKANRVMERYFDTDIQDYVSAMDVFLDNDVDARVAAEIARSMFPEDGNE